MAKNDPIHKLAKAVVDVLSAANKAVSTAESCTGGWISKAITDIPGSSVVFGYGIVCYSNGAKESMLGVKNQTLNEHGSVSEPAVTEMAEGVINLSGSDLAVAVSGIAGPSGGTDEKPIGTVWFAWAVRDQGKVRVEANCEHFDGDRALVRELTVAHALQGVLDRL